MSYKYQSIPTEEPKGKEEEKQDKPKLPLVVQGDDLFSSLPRGVKHIIFSRLPSNGLLSFHRISKYLRREASNYVLSKTGNKGNSVDVFKEHHIWNAYQEKLHRLNFNLIQR